MDLLQSQQGQGQTKQWTDVISDGVLCQWYYWFFVIYAVLAVLSLFGGLFSFLTKGLPTSVRIMVGSGYFLTFGIAAVSFLFHYLICDRALKPKYNTQA
jgi:hypothetical protein